MFPIKFQITAQMVNEKAKGDPDPFWEWIYRENIFHPKPTEFVLRFSHHEMAQLLAKAKDERFVKQFDTRIKKDCQRFIELQTQEVTSFSYQDIQRIIRYKKFLNRLEHVNDYGPNRFIGELIFGDFNSHIHKYRYSFLFINDTEYMHVYCGKLTYQKYRFFFMDAYINQRTVEVKTHCYNNNILKTISYPVESSQMQKDFEATQIQLVKRNKYPKNQKGEIRYDKRKMAKILVYPLHAPPHPKYGEQTWELIL